MSKLRKKFSQSEWDRCCTGMCGDCKIAASYKDKFGKKKGKKKLKKDKEKMAAGE